MSSSMELWAEVRTDGTWKQVDGLVHDQLWQNYDCFAIMCGVRNRPGYQPIFQSRGAPPDYRPDAQYDSLYSPTSWLTVAEIMTFDWTQQIHKRGILPARHLTYWLKYSRPYGETPDSMTEMERDEDDRPANCRPLPEVLAEIEAWSQQNPDRALPDSIGDQLVVVEWDEPYYIAGRYLLSTLLPQLWRLGRPEDVRIVFAID